MATNQIEIDRILCPVDFSEFSGPALGRAVRLANWFDARVDVLHVIPRLPLAMPAGLGASPYPNPVDVTEAQRAQAARGMADLVAPFLAGGVPIETQVLEGEPWRLILKEAEGIPADLLVIGTHGRSGFEQLLLGSVTEKVLRRAPCPVLTVGHVAPHPFSDGMLFRRILCAADLTRASKHTLEVALSLAIESDAQVEVQVVPSLTLLHVMENLPDENAPGLNRVVPHTSPLRHELVAQARAELRKAVPDAARNFCEVTERVETGVPWSEILRVADQTYADLIIIGAHNHGAVGRMFFGSTASHIVRQATCPVLVVREMNKVRRPAEVAEAAAVADR